MVEVNNGVVGLVPAQNRAPHVAERGEQPFPKGGESAEEGS
jgi:hypothetical protein